MKQVSFNSVFKVHLHKKYRKVLWGGLIIVFSIALCLPSIIKVGATGTLSSTEQEKINQIIAAGLAGEHAKFTFQDEVTLFLPLGIEVPLGIQLGSYAGLYGAPEGLKSGRNGDMIDYSLDGIPTVEGNYQMLAVSTSNGDRHYAVKPFNIQVGHGENSALANVYQDVYTAVVQQANGVDEVKVAQSVTKLLYTLLNDVSIKNGYNVDTHGYMTQQYLAPYLTNGSVLEMIHKKLGDYVQMVTGQAPMTGDGKVSQHSVRLETLVQGSHEFITSNGEGKIVLSSTSQTKMMTVQRGTTWETMNYNGVLEHIPEQTIRVMTPDGRGVNEVVVGTRLLVWDAQSEKEPIKIFYLSVDNRTQTLSVLELAYGGATYNAYLLAQ